MTRLTSTVSIAALFVLAAGCLVLTLGSFAPNIYFGAISSLIIVLALICDLLFLPALLAIFKPKMGTEGQAQADDYHLQEAK